MIFRWEGHKSKTFRLEERVAEVCGVITEEAK